MLIAGYPNLSRDQLLEASAVLRTLISRHAWYVLSVDLNLDSAQTARGLGWAVGTLLDDLRRRNDGAVKRSRTAKKK